MNAFHWFSHEPGSSPRWRRSPHAHRSHWLARAALALSLSLLVAESLAATPMTTAKPSTDSTANPDGAVAEQARILRQASAAVVGLRTTAAPQARSIETLGRTRLGSGVVIGPDGLVLTIGYLILEAEKIEVLTQSGRVLPARTVAYDLATGFGLVQPLVPIEVQAAKLGSSSGIDERDPHVIASGGDEAELSIAQVVSRRAFSGYWEYHIEGAVFTIPPRTDHSGAALFNTRGELVGIGSLVVMDAVTPGRRSPGNMFVPIDLLKPVLAELRERGASAGSKRAWLGVNCLEQMGMVRIIRVSTDSPAELGGLQPGDEIRKVDGLEVHSLEAFYKKLWEGPNPERDIVLEIGRGSNVETMTIRSMDRMKHLRGSVGI